MFCLARTIVSYKLQIMVSKLLDVVAIPDTFSVPKFSEVTLGCLEEYMVVLKESCTIVHLYRPARSLRQIASKPVPSTSPHRPLFRWDPN